MQESELLNEEIFRGRFARAFAVVWFFLAVYIAYDTLRYGDGGSRLVALSLTALATVIIYAMAYRPAIVINDNGVLLRNIVRDVWVPWPQVTGIGARWSISVETADRPYVAWAISAGNPHRMTSMQTNPLTFGAYRGPGADEARGQKPGTLVSARLLERWVMRREQAEDGPILVNVTWPIVGALVAGTVFAAAAVALA